VRVLAAAQECALIVKGLPGGYSRDLQETKEPFLAGLATTRTSVRLVNKLVAGLAVDRTRLEAGFSPEVFATDRALDMVANGTPFRDAYAHVRSHLEALGQVDPGAAIARKTHAGAPAGLDFGAYRKRIRRGKSFASRQRNDYYDGLSQLLGVDYPSLDAKPCGGGLPAGD
jgi:argininosuccinate lyase